MQLHLWSVCRRPPDWVSSACEEYLKRLRGKLTLELREFAPAADSAHAQEQKTKEGDRLLKALPSNAYVVALDERGQQWTTVELADALAHWQTLQHVVLIIGGAEGLDARVRQRAQQTWGLSHLTLPHQLARVVVVEQLYRAWSYQNGHPYHRA